MRHHSKLDVIKRSNTDRLKCPFRHNGPREFRLALVPSKCPSCNCSYYHDTKDYPDTKEKLTAYRASVLRHLGLCRGLACAREFFEYVVAVQEPAISFPGHTLLVAFFLMNTHTYSCKGCNAVGLPSEIDRVIAAMRDAMVKRPSNSFADFPRTVQSIQQRMTTGSSQVDQTQCDAGMCHGSQPSPHDLPRTNVKNVTQACAMACSPVHMTCLGRMIFHYVGQRVREHAHCMIFH